MSGDREEPKRVLGMPRGTDPYARQGEETQRAFGIPLDWYGALHWDRLRALRHPIKAYRRWTLIRRLGPYAPDEDDDPQPTR
jgi:hypothetical protein